MAIHESLLATFSFLNLWPHSPACTHDKFTVSNADEVAGVGTDVVIRQALANEFKLTLAASLLGGLSQLVSG